MQVRTTWGRQRGAVIIIVALALVVLIGFAGLVLDLGRLYVNRSELQNAADACALAAAAELTCDTSQAGACTTTYLQSAVDAGHFTALRNSRDFQRNPVDIGAADIRFSRNLSQNGTNSEYRSLADGAEVTSKYAMCIARAAGIAPWFMGVLGVDTSNVDATAVATLGPTQHFCTSMPIGICAKSSSSSSSSSSSASDYGYAAGEWIRSDFHGETLDGNFRWVDFTPNAGGTRELRDQLAKREPVCDLRIGSNVVQAGVHQGAKSAYNTRFGIYSNAYSLEEAPPDETGYAYPNKAPGSPVIAIGTSALSDYQGRLSNHDPFDASQYDDAAVGGKISGNPHVATRTELQNFGGQRRLNAVPIIDCSAGHNQTPILAMGCVLMLNPMSSGANGTIYVEYVKDASVLNGPCRTSGAPGGDGPLAPVLVQ